MDYFHSHGKGIIAILSLLLIHLVYVATAAFNVTSIPFNRGFSPLFGDGNVVRSSDDKSVSLVLNQYTGSGFKSSDLYNHGFFSARIKLPSEYTAGIVVAFYTTNGDIFQKTHDELDFEFLGNIRGKRWRFQTNVYGNGSGGREERYYLWFDPSKEFHRYSILWTNKSIMVATVQPLHSTCYASFESSIAWMDGPDFTSTPLHPKNSLSCVQDEI